MQWASVASRIDCASLFQRQFWVDELPCLHSLFTLCNSLKTCADNCLCGNAAILG